MGASGTSAKPNEDVRLLYTGERCCGYWPDHTTRDLVLDPRDPRLANIYPHALSWGFRRSGNLVYRPHCHQCRACVPVRIPVERFEPNRSQRRCAARNAKVEMRITAAERTEEHLKLYRRYLGVRHRDGGMDHHDASEFDQFLVGRWSDTCFLELRQGGRLLAVAVTDRTEEALSAVYTFYEPDLAHLGLGTLAILRQLEWARRDHHHHLYLGYWIENHRKMDYKRRFTPLEAFDGRHWQMVDGTK